MRRSSAAGIGAYGGETGPVNDTVHGNSRTTAAATAKRDDSGNTARSGVVTRPAMVRRVRILRLEMGPQPDDAARCRLCTTRRVDTLSGARAGVLKPAVAAAPAIRCANRGPKFGRLYRPGSARAGGATNVSAAALRPPSMLLSAASRPTAILRPVAVNGASAVPRAAGPAASGGPAKSKTVD